MASEFSWWTIVPTLVGGGISLVTTLFVQSRARGAEERRKTRDAKRLAAYDAYLALMKLVKTFEAIENLARHYDSLMDEAKAEGRGGGEPCDIYKALVGAGHRIDEVTAAEFFFLAAKHGELVRRIGEIQQRAINNVVLSQEYSRSRAEFDHFLLSVISEETVIDDSTISLKTSGEIKKKLDFQKGKLNQIIVPLIESLEEDRKSFNAIISDFIAAARTEFGNDFPFKGIEMRSLSDHANP